jgi:hypothetical protein
MTDNESIAVAQVELAKAESARAGRYFGGGNQIIANGIAPVAAIPTTTATLALYNAEDPGGLSYEIDRIGFWLGSGTAAAGATLFATVSPAKIVTAPTANATGYGSASMSGSTRVTKAIWTTAVTVPSPTGRAPAWIQISSNFQLAAANVGQGDGYVEMNGCLLVPPGYALGFAILSGAGTTPLYGISASWSEMQKSLE